MTFLKWIQASSLRLRAASAHIKRDRSGATAIEYGLIVAGIAIAVIAVVFTLGTELNTIFNTANNAINNANTTAAG